MTGYCFVSTLDSCQQTKCISAPAFWCPLFLGWRLPFPVLSYMCPTLNLRLSWTPVSSLKCSLIPADHRSLHLLNTWCCDCLSHPFEHWPGVNEQLVCREQGSGLNCFACNRYSLDSYCLDYDRGLIEQPSWRLFLCQGTKSGHGVTGIIPSQDTEDLAAGNLAPSVSGAPSNAVGDGSAVTQGAPGQCLSHSRRVTSCLCSFWKLSPCSCQAESFLLCESTWMLTPEENHPGVLKQWPTQPLT